MTLSVRTKSAVLGLTVYTELDYDAPRDPGATIPKTGNFVFSSPIVGPQVIDDAEAQRLALYLLGAPENAAIVRHFDGSITIGRVAVAPLVTHPIEGEDA